MAWCFSGLNVKKHLYNPLALSNLLEKTPAVAWQQVFQADMNCIDCHINGRTISWNSGSEQDLMDGPVKHLEYILLLGMVS